MRWAAAVLLAACVARHAGAAVLAYVPNSADDTVSVIDTASNRVVQTIPVGRAPTEVQVSPDGATVYVGNSLALTISVIDTGTNAVRGTIALPGADGSVPQGPTDLAIDPTGEQLFAAEGTDVHVIDTKSGALTATLGGSRNDAFEAPLGLALHPNGHLLYVGDDGPPIDDEYANAALLVCDLRTIAPSDIAGRSFVDTVPVSLAVVGPDELAITPDGSRLYIAHDATPAGVVDELDTQTNTLAATIPVGTNLGGIVVRPDGARVYVAHSAGNEVAVIDAATRKVVRRIPVEVAPVGLSLDQAGTRLYVVNSGSDSVCTIDTSAEQVIATVHVGRSPRAYGSFVTTTTGSIAGVIDDVGPRLDAIATIIDGATESSRVKQRLTKLITRAAARLRSAAVGGKRGRRRLAGAERLVDAFITALERAKRRDKIDEAAADAMSATAHALRGMIAQARLAARPRN